MLLIASHLSLISWCLLPSAHHELFLLYDVPLPCSPVLDSSSYELKILQSVSQVKLPSFNFGCGYFVSTTTTKTISYILFLRLREIELGKYYVTEVYRKKEKVISNTLKKEPSIFLKSSCNKFTYT